MKKQSIRLGSTPKKLSALDPLADVQQWQVREILAGVAEADAGQVVDHGKVKAMAARWSHPIDSEALPKLRRRAIGKALAASERSG